VAAPRVHTHAPAAGTLSLPALRVRATLVRATLAGGLLLPPTDPASVGRWTGSAAVGARHGATVIVGHTVRNGYGAFDALSTLTRGDRVTAHAGSGTATYVVTSVRTYSKAVLAARSATLFRQTGPARLVLITCSGWDGKAYTSNVVVVAAAR
jgi:LPXTG-site transpeptidase (sortase) family protein